MMYASTRNQQRAGCIHGAYMVHTLICMHAQHIEWMGALRSLNMEKTEQTEETNGPTTKTVRLDLKDIRRLELRITEEHKTVAAVVTHLLECGGVEKDSQTKQTNQIIAIIESLVARIPVEKK